MKYNFNLFPDSCKNDAKYKVTLSDGYVRYICKEHIEQRLS